MRFCTPLGVQSNGLIDVMTNNFNATRLESILDPEKNALTLVRLLAALSVIISHAFEIAVARDAPQPLEGLTPFNLGQHAVNAFFVISGLTLAQALARNHDLKRFFAARVLRIFPALFGYGLVFAFIVGPAMTAISWRDYFSSGATWTYPLSILVAFAEAAPPPGILETVPVAGVVNEPLWTIRYELAAYVGLAMLAWLGFFPRPKGVVFASCLALIGYVAIEAAPQAIDSIGGIGSLTRFAVCFLLGVLAYIGRRRIIISPVYLVAFVPLLWILSETPLGRPAYVLFTAYFVFLLASFSFGALGTWTRRNDISYGTYLYGWPIQQSLMAIFPNMTIATNMAAGIIFALLAGYASWTLIERRALGIKERIRARAC